jgi:hypothetical protein
MYSKDFSSQAVTVDVPPSAAHALLEAKSKGARMRHSESRPATAPTKHCTEARLMPNRRANADWQ